MTWPPAVGVPQAAAPGPDEADRGIGTAVEGHHSTGDRLAASAGQGVQRRGLDVGVAVRPEGIGPLVVGDDPQDVGLVLCRERNRQP